jgi:hypothetical protein
MPDHEIENTIQTLTDQVEALLADNEQLREANSEWHDLIEEHDVEYVKTAVEFASDNDIEAIGGFLDDVDFDAVADALRYTDIDDLVKAHSKIDEYGDPEEMAEKLERLEEEVQESQNNASDDSVSREDYNAEVAIRQDTQYMLNETQNVLSVVTAERDSYKRSYEEYKASTEYQLDLASGLRDTLAATEENQGLLSEELEHTVAALESVRADYKRLADYNSRICRECDALREAQVGIYTPAKEQLLKQYLDLKVIYDALREEYFSHVSGFDDVPSSKPTTEGDWTCFEFPEGYTPE